MSDVNGLRGVLQQQGLLMMLVLAFGAKEVCRALQPPGEFVHEAQAILRGLGPAKGIFGS
jgi:hypothetical protein